MDVTIHVNGAETTREVEDRTLLAYYLRDACGLTGTNIGCDTTTCGACTVLLDGESVKSCTVLAAQAEGSSITTIEGLAAGARGSRAGDGKQRAEDTTGERGSDPMHPLQRAFHEEHGLQCGFCTPGMIMAAASLLDENPWPTEEQVRTALEGNLCRCTGYHNIVRAVLSAAAEMTGSSGGASDGSPGGVAARSVEEGGA